MREWMTTKEFLELFSVDVERNGAKNFIDITELMGLMYAFPEYGVNDHLLCRSYLRQLKLSPLVFWGRIKRDIVSILSADSDVLEALGCPLPETRTSADLMRVLARALADDIEEQGREKFREIALQVKDMCVVEGR